jgi:hypothetical protein
VPVGIFPNSLKKEAHCCLGDRGTLILNFLGKRKERLKIGGKESFLA